MHDHISRLQCLYTYRWGFNDTVIWFQVQVQTLGYVGFGISENGKMAPADVFVAYVTDNQRDNFAYFKVCNPL